MSLASGVAGLNWVIEAALWRRVVNLESQLRTITRLFVVASMAVAAVAAHAFTIDIVSAGKDTTGFTVDFHELVLLQVTSVPLPLFTNVDYSIVNNMPPQPGSGSFSNGTGDSLLFNQMLDSVSFSPTSVSGSGTWVYTGGTGAYAGLAGLGTFAFTINTTTNASYSTFSGLLDAVPEPGSMALLGLGVAAVAGRRLRKSV